MFDRFTDRARKVMGLTRQEAQRFNHQYIGTEHILLGLIQEGSGVAANVLRNLDVDPEKIRAEVGKIVQDGTTMVTMGQLPFTPYAKRCLELSADAADDLHHNYIGTEHLLLGLLGEHGGLSAGVLQDLGLTAQRVREEVVELLGSPQDVLRVELRTDFPKKASIPNFDLYQEFTRTTAVYPSTGKQCFESAAYCTFGLTGEAGEVAEKMKKRFRLGGTNAFLPGSVVTYDKTGEDETYEQFVDTVKKELGDVLWYVAGLAAELGLNLSDVAQSNVEKLSSRKQRGVLKGDGDDR